MSRPILKSGGDNQQQNGIQRNNMNASRSVTFGDTVVREEFDIHGNLVRRTQVTTEAPEANEIAYWLFGIPFVLILIPLGVVFLTLCLALVILSLPFFIAYGIGSFLYRTVKSLFS